MSSSEDTEACREMQTEEWEVLEAIFPDCVSLPLKDGSFELEIPIQFPESRKVEIINDGSTSNLSSGVLSLRNLPSVQLSLHLPKDYPMHSPPVIKFLHTTHTWLPRTASLRKMLQAQWESEQPVLYNWIEFIRGAQFLEDMQLSDSSTGTVIIPHHTPETLAPLLVMYETTANSDEFRQNTFPCGVCLEDVKGTRCLRLAPCLHVFCRTCLEDFWKLSIAEGSVVRCPDPKCVKTEAVEAEVARVVNEEELERWRWLREKRELEKDPTIVHCPLESCQKPVPKPKPDGDTGKAESEEEASSGWGRLRICACSYSFCAFCRRTWHGPISDCPIPFTAAFLLEYMSHKEGSTQRRAIEQKYGKTNIKKMLLKHEEDQANRDYMESNTVPCTGQVSSPPAWAQETYARFFLSRCQIHVEKTFGCNHMSCPRCNQHFCYRCGGKINATNPYLHFNTPGQPCYGKLFDLQDIDTEWQPIEGFDAL